MSEREYVKGGSFLLHELAATSATFTPEDFTPEDGMLAKTARDFVEKEVLPVSDRIEAKDPALMRELLEKAGALGLMMADIPEAYGGLGLTKAACALVTEASTGQASFLTMLMGHNGIGTLPVVYYGTPAQKEKYLPGLADGSLIGAYALTEPTAGSDALSARTRAVLSDDGEHYLLTGQKQFITNGTIADLFTVFAKVDGDEFTGFLVDRDTPGLSIGPEEEKMGIRGSLTTSVYLEEAKVPVENVLGEVGKGHKIAFNILNIGRFRLGVSVVGAGKRALSDALAHALERKQFGKRIAEFGAIREKLAQMFTRLYAAEAMVYRTVGLIDGVLEGSEDRYGQAGLKSIEEYAAECAMVKVYATEMLDYVVDEAVQCLGGYGFCAEYPVERYYRDNRINRIYEGTNEINRILIPTLLLRRDASGELALLETAGQVGEPAMVGQGAMGAEKALVANLKKIALLVLHRAAEKYGGNLGREQMIVTRLADLFATAYGAESALVRALKDVERRGEEAAILPVAAARITCEEAVEKAETLARQCLVSLGELDMLARLPEFIQRDPADVLALRETIAAKLVEMERLVV